MNTGRSASGAAHAVPPPLAAPMALPTRRLHPFDPPPELGKFRTQGSLGRLVYPDGHVGWVVTDARLARVVLSDPRFSSRGELRRHPVQENVAFSGRPAYPGWFMFMDPPDHTRYRRLLSRWFTVRRVGELRPRIQEFADRLDAMEQAGPPAELMEAFALPIPSLVICELLRVPYSEHSEFEHNSAILVSLNSSPREREKSLEAMTGLLRRVVRHRRSHSADDLLSSLARSGQLTDDELAGVGAFLLLAGHETTANMLALGTFALLCNPVQLNLLRQDRALVGEAVEELLRYLTIFAFGLFRTAREDVEWTSTRSEQVKASRCPHRPPTVIQKSSLILMNSISPEA